MSETRAGWLLDEVASAGRENLDAGHVARDDAKEDASARGEVELLVSLGLDQDSVLVDIGAGTGQLALPPSRRCARVVAVDVSPVMLDALDTHVRDQGRTDVEAGWTRAELEEHMRDESSTCTWLLEPMIERSGFEITDAIYSQDRIFARYIARAR